MARANLYSADNVRPGFSYTAPTVTLSASNAAINGGLSFDLPLASISSNLNQAYFFTNQGAQNAYGFLGGVIEGGQNRLHSAATRAQAYGNVQANNTFARGQSLFSSAMGMIERINERNNFYNYRAVKKQSSGGCFITTAICESENKPDNCAELTTLRKWRDEKLAKMDGGQDCIQHYYDIAPAICEKLKARKDSVIVFHTLKNAFLIPAIDSIEKGDDAAAFQTYVNMIIFADYMTVH